MTRHPTRAKCGTERVWNWFSERKKTFCVLVEKREIVSWGGCENNCKIMTWWAGIKLFCFLGFLECFASWLFSDGLEKVISYGHRLLQLYFKMDNMHLRERSQTAPIDVKPEIWKSRPTGLVYYFNLFICQHVRLHSGVRIQGFPYVLHCRQNLTWINWTNDTKKLCVLHETHRRNIYFN